MISSRAMAFAAQPGVKQFVKFCLVGASSTVIDFGTLNLLHSGFHVPLLTAITIAFLLAVTNGFYWNSRWTFRDGKGDPREQYPKFLATNLIGFVLNVTIMTLALSFGARLGYLHTNASLSRILQMMALGQGKEIFSPLAVNCAKAIATVCVTAWNYTASRFWTFKSAESPA